MSKVEQAFALAKERYAELGVDVDAALERVAKIEISLHCWQGDDVIGFESGANCALTPKKRSRSSPESNASTCTLSISKTAARRSIAMKSNRATSKDGSTGRKRKRSG